ncbi:ABC transporter permease [Paenibacillus sp. R14(2021)]|uniref:ABC transporter permease n=1 Tax=Paenibacillus sp. R14(2021) TaxID=2859228 RepID=UPI001C61426D|nr:ABC transporter permease subunit [Paenibacillus sp. R14(2021)]
MNKTLFAGLLITILMIAASFFGKYVYWHDLNEHLEVSYTNGVLVVPPSPPNGDYLFGTDKYGYDLLAKLLDGARFTILGAVGVAFARVLIGGMLGLILGYFGKVQTNRGGRFTIWNVLNGIPVFIIVWMIMIGFTMNPKSTAIWMTFILTLIMTILGIPSVAASIKEKATLIREKQFVLSAKSIGASHWTIIRSHIFPHLKENFTILFVQEVVLTLGLFGQLAIFNIFVGGTKMLFDPIEYMSRTNEWSGLIGQARSNLDIYPWVIFFPLSAYIVFILGFHLISVGLEKKYQKQFAKYSHI